MASATMRKRSRGEPEPHPQGPVVDDAFINDQDAVDSAGDDDDDDDKPKGDKKAGRRKIKIEFIQDKSRRHITFSKRKAGIMKKAYELSTLTGTQVLLLVVSETGLVYTFTTAKLQPLVTQPEGKNLIQACLNAPHGTLPSSMPVGTPIGRSSNPIATGTPAQTPNIPGGLSIGQSPGSAKEEEVNRDDDEGTDRKRRRRNSNGASTQPPRSSAPGPAQSPHSPNPPPLSIPPGSSGPASAHPNPSSAAPGPPAQLPMGSSPTSPPTGHSQVPGGPQGQYANPPAPYASHGHHPQQQQQQGDGSSMYPQHMGAPGGYMYSSGQGTPQQPLGGLASAAAQQHGHWSQPPQQQQQVHQGAQYGRR